MDWNEIKTEYITTNTSYRKLAQKYNIPKTTLEHRAKTEKWFAAKRQYNDRVVAKTIQKAEDKAVDCKTTLYELAKKVAGQIDRFINEYDLAAMIAAGIKPKDITGAIKDLKDVLDIKSEADIKEQDARIKNLQRQANAADDSAKAIEITVKGYDDEWSN